jgi:hypothetical protein
MPYDSPMTALRHLQNPTVLRLATSETQDATSGVKAVGQVALDASAFTPGTTFWFIATLSVSNVALTGRVSLYNLTDGEIVTNSILTTSSTTPVKVSGAALVVGVAPGNFKPSEKLYEVRIQVLGGALPVDIVTVGSVVLWAQYP